MISIKQEQQLVENLRAGQSGAVRWWFKNFSPYLLRLTIKRVPSQEDAEEIVQETFVNCLKQLPLFRGQSRLRTWMISILHHEIADFYRRRYAKKTLQTIPLAKVLVAEPIKDASQTALKVREVLAKMTKNRQELLMMKYVDRHKVKDIAEKLNTTVKAVESELFRARQEFRALYVMGKD